MIPVPISDEILAAHPEGRRVVLGEPGMNPADDHAPTPCEYLVTPSTLYPGRPCFTALLELSDDERAAIADGARVALTLDGAEIPWSVEVVS